VYGCMTGNFFKGPGWDHEMRDMIQRAAGESIAVFTHPLYRLKVNRARTTVVRCSELIQLRLGQFFLHAPQRSGIGADIA
jgi:hypothetical protein